MHASGPGTFFCPMPRAPRPVSFAALGRRRGLCAEHDLDAQACPADIARMCLAQLHHCRVRASFFPGPGAPVSASP